MEHYFMRCKAYVEARRRMMGRIGRERVTKEDILGEPRWPALFKFANETGRFAEMPKMKEIKIGKKNEVAFVI